jgi:hypothetical protein
VRQKHFHANKVQVDLQRQEIIATLARTKVVMDVHDQRRLTNNIGDDIYKSLANCPSPSHGKNFVPSMY